MVKNLPANEGNTDLIPGLGRSPKEEMATHSRSLAWEIPWIENSGRLQYMGLQKDTTEHTHSMGVPHQNIHQLQAAELC